MTLKYFWKQKYDGYSRLCSSFHLDKKSSLYSNICLSHEIFDKYVSLIPSVSLKKVSNIPYPFLDADIFKSFHKTNAYA